jgi:hypothetical protein
MYKEAYKNEKLKNESVGYIYAVVLNLSISWPMLLILILVGAIYQFLHYFTYNVIKSFKLEKYIIKIVDFLK